MIKREVVIKNKIGLHARPAALFVKKAEAFDCEIWVSKNGIKVNGKSILSLLTLAAEEGSVIVLEITGPDEVRAFEELSLIFAEEEE